MERMTDKRMAEIDSTRLDFGKRNPLPADSELSEELLQALKADRAQLKAVRGCQRYIDLGGGSIQESPTGEYLLTRDVLKAIGEGNQGATKEK